MVNWLSMLVHPTVILISGRRRYGKTALGMYLLELLHVVLELPCYVVGLPKEKEQFLPNFIQNIPLSLDLPENCAIFIDEAAMKIYARNSWKNTNKWISDILGASAQKGQTILFASHHTRKLDINIIMDFDIWAMKYPSRWYIRFERKEIIPLVKEAFELFHRIPEEKRKENAVVYEHESGPTILSNPLPSFWTPELSKVFEGVSLSKQKNNRENTINDVMSEPSMPTREEIQLEAERIFQSERAQAGLPAIKPTRQELSEGSYLRRAQQTLMTGYRGEMLRMIGAYEEEAGRLREELGIKERETPLPVEKPPIGKPEITPDVFSRWSLLHEEVKVGDTPIDIRAWIDKRMTVPQKELTLTEEDELKKSSVYVKNGLTIHWKDDIHEQVWEAIADLLGTTSDRLSDSSIASTVPGRDRTISFDLTRKTPTSRWKAAGGRFDPSELIMRLNEINFEKASITMDPIYAEDIA